MRPITLTLSAFGPYIYEEINLDTLGNQGIYLITGDTGAGKTTIFDAITYALYGAASGEVRDANMFRCKYADMDTPTFVELVFEYAGKQYYVKRIPAYERRTKNGKGTTKQLATAELHLPDGKIITKTKEVTSMVEEIMGITCAQFTQIAMIAQGEFLKLLHASTEERVTIFRKIFQTGNYQKLQDKLKDDMLKLYKSYDKLMSGIKQYIEGIHVGESSDGRTNNETLEGSIQEIVGRIEEIIARDQALEKKMREEIDKIERQMELLATYIRLQEEKNARLEEQEKINLAYQEQYEKLQSNKKRLEDEEAKEAIRQALGEELILLEQELGKYSEIEQKKQSVASIVEKLEALEENLKNHTEKIVNYVQQNGEYKAERLELKEAQVECNQAETRLKNCCDIRKEQEKLEEEIIKSNGIRQQFIELLEKLERSIQLLEEKEASDKEELLSFGNIHLELEKVNQVQKELDGQKEECQVLDQEIVAYKKEYLLVKNGQEEYLKLENQSDKLEQVYIAKQKAYLDEQAGILAQGLQEGEACPVCGSTHHIAKAELTKEAPTKEALELAKQQSEQATEATAKASENVAVHRTNLAHQKVQMEEKIKKLLVRKEERDISLEFEMGTVINVERNLQELEEKIDSKLYKNTLKIKGLEDKILKQESLQNQLLSYEIQLQEARQQLKNAQEEYTERIVSNRTHYLEVLTGYEKNIADLGDQSANDDLVQRIAVVLRYSREKQEQYTTSYNEATGRVKRYIRLDRMIETNEIQMKEIQDGEKRLLVDKATLESELDHIKTDIKTTVEQLKWSRQEEAEQVVKEKSETLRELRAQYERVRKEYNEIQSQFDQLKGRREVLQQAVSLAMQQEQEQQEMYEPFLAFVEEELYAEQEKLRENKNVRTDALTDISTSLRSNQINLRNIIEKQSELEKVEQQYIWMKQLSDTANGTVTQKEKIMLETFIQMTYFDRIIRRANQRFMKMTSDQYELKRQESTGSLVRQKGLDLNVIDYYNGTERSVKTLSGGESFKASLALALGLADEIQSSAGGIKLDTMFVDEGFGSLDDESLQQAIQILMGLSEGNRLVGIISHVDELKEKIDKQLIIRKKGSSGSYHSIKL